MGSLWGHLDEGIVFVLVALWWMVHMYKEYIKNGGKDGFHVPMSYTCYIRGREIPLEIYFKIFFSVGGALIELFNGHGPYFVDEEGNFAKVSSLQHISIYCMFLTHSVLDLLRHFKLLYIEGLDHLTLALSFIWYGLIFNFHTKFNSDGLETIIHSMGLVWCLASGACVLWEFRSNRKFVPCYCKVLMVLGLGTWFVQTPFFLFDPSSKFPSGHRNPKWDRDSHKNYQFVATLFGFHLCFNIIVSVVVYLIVKALSADQKYRETIRFRRIPNGDCERLDEQEKLLSEDEI